MNQEEFNTSVRDWIKAELPDLEEAKPTNVGQFQFVNAVSLDQNAYLQGVNFVWPDAACLQRQYEDLLRWAALIQEHTVVQEAPRHEPVMVDPWHRRLFGF